MTKKILFFMIGFLMSVTACWADTLYLKDGNVIRGTVVEKTENYVKLDLNGVFMTYFKREIDHLEYGGNISPVGPLPWMPEADVEQSKEVVPPVVAPRVVSENKKRLILRFIEASNTRTNMANMFSQLIAQVPEGQQKKLQEILNVDEISLRLVPIYDRYFTEEELQELILFYKSAAGSKLIAVTPSIMADSLRVSTLYFQEKMSGFKE